MIKISKNEASKRIFKIAKTVAEIEALNGALTPLQEKSVRTTVAKILAASEIEEDELDKIGEELKEEAGFAEADEETKEEVKQEGGETEEDKEETCTVGEEEKQEVKEEKTETAADGEDEELEVNEEIQEDIETEKKFDNQAVRKMNQGSIKQFISKNKMKKLKGLEQFISELADRGVYFKNNTLNIVRLGQLLTAIEQAMNACVKSDEK